MLPLSPNILTKRAGRTMSTSNIPHDDNVTLVFGLTKAQLRPVVDHIAEEPVASFDVSIEQSP